MGLQGEDLGVELGTLLYAGRTLLPEVADDYRTALANTPTSVSGVTWRGGGLGRDPGEAINSQLELMSRAIRETESNLRKVGQALVWCARDYAGTESEVATAMRNMKRSLEEQHQ